MADALSIAFRTAMLMLGQLAFTPGLIQKCNEGSVAEPTGSLGPRLRIALNLRRTDATRNDVGLKCSSRERMFQRPLSDCP
jgi:hypothetical protein